MQFVRKTQYVNYFKASPNRAQVTLFLKYFEKHFVNGPEVSAKPANSPRWCFGSFVQEMHGHSLSSHWFQENYSYVIMFKSDTEKLEIIMI